jgi:hypothetical protein
MTVISPNTPRTCGSCSLCCKLLAIDELDKPAGRWCRHCRPGRGGCSIYADRPDVCRGFHCGWLDGVVGNYWYPLRSHLVLTRGDPDDRRDQYGRPVSWHLIYVDPDYPEIWRREPYWTELRRWVLMGLRGAADGSARWTAVMVGARTFIVLPDRAVEVTAAAGVTILEVAPERWRVIAFSAEAAA